ncbi:hypothetical protein [Intestinibacillus sp. Marseille-P6563]|uniref:hypothetical protein n=1 Tax=Intestinibacillus sp. Marseille-P6563 TaxID=2364792 RepID=UPI0013DF8A5E|nr:hypothetical protein [Intestinibacillus sp. Marseille-P6563]
MMLKLRKVLWNVHKTKRGILSEMEKKQNMVDKAEGGCYSEDTVKEPTTNGGWVIETK